MVGREKKWRQLAQRPQFSPHSGAKTNDKSKISGRMITTGISDVVIASVYSEKPI